ncbi:IEC3 subunit of the Ino80 complex, chromatin re-modelling-domain-containing protein [Lipomyces arxii]|uniref:IEC3 subunit of the Ino80 complex, chromatin re-modelling-domain-containing protein n=1 Tax=Lipomyces arxii TaxID=56418 RepID=UPI0034CD5BBF
MDDNETQSGSGPADVSPVISHRKLLSHVTMEDSPSADSVNDKLIQSDALPKVASHFDIRNPEDVLKPTSPPLGAFTAREPYKSFRKKYRKLRLRFDAVLGENEELENLDAASKKTMKRLNLENARLLDMLVDLSESPHINKQFQMSGLGVDGGADETERQQKMSLLLAGNSAELGNVDSPNGARNLFSGEKILRRPQTPPYLRDEMLLLQDDYDTDF